MEELETYQDYQHFTVGDRFAIAGTALAFTLILLILLLFTL